MITLASLYAFEATGWKTYMISTGFNVAFLAYVQLCCEENCEKSLREIDVFVHGENTMSYQPILV